MVSKLLTMLQHIKCNMLVETFFFRNSVLAIGCYCFHFSVVGRELVTAKQLSSDQFLNQRF